MAINGTTTNYTGRQKDLCIMNPSTPTSTSAQPVSLQFGRHSTYCAGIQKLVQRYVVVLLTTLGSQSSYPTFGTDFMTSIATGSSYSTSRLYHLFNFANIEATQLFVGYQRANPTLPADEQLLSAQLVGLSVSGDKLNMSIRIVSQAGDTVTYVTPLPLTGT